MLQYWTGPATVVAYVTDEEILLLVKKLQRSVAACSHWTHSPLHW